MKNLRSKLLDKKGSNILPHLSSVADTLFSFFKDNPPYPLIEQVYSQQCNDFSCSDSHLFVFNSRIDEIEIISDTEQRQKTTEPLSQSSSRGKIPSPTEIKLNSRQSYFSKGVFIQKEGLVFFRTPDGGLKQWIQKDNYFVDHDTTSLQEASCFAVDSLTQKVYYFNNQSMLYSFNLNSGEITKITSLRQRGIYKMELIEASQDYIVFQS